MKRNILIGVLFVALMVSLLVIGGDVERVNTCADDAVAFDEMFLNMQKNHLELMDLYSNSLENEVTEAQLARFDELVTSNNTLTDQHDARVNSSECTRLTNK